MRHNINLLRLLLILPVFVVAGVFVALTEDCSGSSADSAAIPRRTVYPRIEICDSTYKPYSYAKNPIIEVNAHAKFSQGIDGSKGTFSSIFYPSYDPRKGVRVECTTRRWKDIDNLTHDLKLRHERIALNVGSNEARVTTLTSPDGITSTIVTSPASTVTPVQLLSTDSTTFVFSAVLFIPDREGVEPEYYAPIVSGVERDLIHMAKTMRQR